MENKKRKTRSDKIYKYTKKNGKMQPYYPKRNRNDPLKTWWWKEERTSSEGIQRIPPQLRATASKIVFKPYLRVDIDPKELSNKEKVENMALLTIGSEGAYLLMMFCHAKNKFHCSPKKVARVVIKQSNDGLVAVMTNNYRLHRYFFWENNWRNRR